MRVAHVLKHARAYTAALVAVIMLAFCASISLGCVVDESNVSPDQARELADLDARKAAAEKKAAEARALGDELAAKAAAEEQRAVEAALLEFEARVIRERMGPILGAVAWVHPGLVPFTPFVNALLPLFGKRGWQNLVRGTRRAARGDAKGAGASALAFFGVGHSTKDSARASEAAGWA